MYSAPHLPDEIVKEILSPALLVPDEAFASTSWKSPFANYQLTSSTILVVCKDWLRVATPLLYETVILRSKAQAQALAAAVKNDAQLGTFIKKVRLEGGYGNSVYEIFKRSPNIRHLWQKGGLASSESVAGYAKAFNSVSLEALIIVDGSGRSTGKINDSLYEAIAQAIKGNWRDLSFVSLSHSSWYRRAGMDAVMEACSTLSKLKVVRFDQNQVSSGALKMMQKDNVQEIQIISRLPKPAFEKLRIVPTFWNGTKTLETVMKENKSVYRKAVYQLPDTPAPPAGVALPAIVQATAVTLSANPSWKPLANSNANDQARIWTLILREAMMLDDDFGLPNLPFDRPVTYFIAETWREYISNLPIVSKAFNALVTPLLYERVLVTSQRGVRALALSPNKKFIRSLWVSGIIVLPSDLIASCPNLVTVSNPFSLYAAGIEGIDLGFRGLFQHVYQDLSVSLSSSGLFTLRNVSQTLRHLHLSVQLTGRERFNLINEAFQSLAQLDGLQSLVVSGLDGKTQSNATKNPRLPHGAFSKLECLAVPLQGSAFAARFLLSLKDVELPALRRVDLRGFQISDNAKAFLKVHGQKLSILQAQFGYDGLFSAHCPNVRHWIVPAAVAKKDRYEFHSLNLSQSSEVLLETIVILDAYFCRRTKEAPRLLDLDFSSLPHLREIVVNGLVWPINQRGIEKSQWVPVAERLLEQGIQLKNNEGVAWTPRLQAVKRGRK
ncbi:hypothetical protein BKA70DRAFT_1149250 [Coprinopsis sp. MPI-PUGE-AT-0042]|nr:hypothetical protein BKA70DRAFT_1149250 [Coprinopsis sp. MPI-PUGE-AT-0042]